MIACSPWRNVLMVVTRLVISFTPPFSRTEPFNTQPASSKSFLAASTSRAHLVLGELTAAGTTRTLQVGSPVGPYIWSAIAWRSIARLMALRTAASIRNGWGWSGSERLAPKAGSGLAKFTTTRSTPNEPPATESHLPAARMGSSTAFGICRFHEKSTSPVSHTARAAEVASPPPFISTSSKNTLSASRKFGLRS